MNNEKVKAEIFDFILSHNLSTCDNGVNITIQKCQECFAFKVFTFTNSDDYQEKYFNTPFGEISVCDYCNKAYCNKHNQLTQVFVGFIETGPLHLVTTCSDSCLIKYKNEHFTRSDFQIYPYREVIDRWPDILDLHNLNPF